MKTVSDAIQYAKEHGYQPTTGALFKQDGDTQQCCTLGAIVLACGYQDTWYDYLLDNDEEDESELYDEFFQDVMHLPLAPAEVYSINDLVGLQDGTSVNDWDTMLERWLDPARLEPLALTPEETQAVLDTIVCDAP